MINEFNLADEAPGSICPKGWKLPMSGATTESGSFSYLLNEAGIDNKDVIKFVDEPYYATRAGYVEGTTSLLAVAGSEARYWSSSIMPRNRRAAYYLRITDNINAAYTDYTQNAFSVRCVVIAK